MPSRFLDSLRTIGFGIESSPPYTALANSAVEYAIRAYNVKYSPEIEEYTRKYAVDHWGSFESVLGKRMCKVSFSIDIDWGGANATAPKWFDLMRACGFLATAHGLTGQSLRSSSQAGLFPITIWIQDLEEGPTPRSIGIQTSGAMGNCKIVGGGVGQPVRIDFEFSGCLASIADQSNANTKLPTGFDTTIPEAQLSVAVTAFGDTLTINTFELDLGNQVEMELSLATASGYIGAHIVDRNPTLKMDPYMHLLTTSGATPHDFMSKWSNATTGALSIAIGTHLVLTAPAIQVSKAYQPGERGRMITNNLEFKFTRDTTNKDYGIEILQGSKT